MILHQVTGNVAVLLDVIHIHLTHLTGHQKVDLASTSKALHASQPLKEVISLRKKGSDQEQKYIFLDI